MIEIALVSNVDPLGDIELHVGGTAGQGRSTTFLIIAAVRPGEGVRSLEVPLENVGSTYLDDYVRLAETLHIVAPRVVVPVLLEELDRAHPGLDRALVERVRSILARAGEFDEDPELREPQPPPENPNDELTFLEGAPFPSSGLTEAELAEFAIELPAALRATANTTSLARARARAWEFATTTATRLSGSAFERRVRRLTHAAEQVLTWTGEAPRAEVVRGWSSAPLAAHPVALALLASAALSGPSSVATPVHARAEIRPLVLDRIAHPKTRRHLVKIELAASVAATLQASFTHRGLREELPPRRALISAGLHAADAALGPEGRLDAARAKARLAEVLAPWASADAVARAADLGSRSVAKLAESSERPPVRDWARGDLDAAMEPWMFTQGPRRD